MKNTSTDKQSVAIQQQDHSTAADDIGNTANQAETRQQHSADTNETQQEKKGLLSQIENIKKEFNDFVYIISHDLNAPLRAIKALTDWLAADYADKLDDDGKEQLHLLSNRVDRMHNLLEGVLQYSRIGRMTEDSTQIDLNQLVPEIIESLNSPPDIHITIENQLPVIVSEPTRIQQVFQNLLSNAVKFMDKSEGFVKIACEEKAGYWEFSISDNGPGIDEKDLNRIFRLFQTLQPKDQCETAGAGLTLAKKIVELYGGKIWLKSKTGEGTTFFFSLPILKAGEKDNTKVSEAALQTTDK